MLVQILPKTALKWVNRRENPITKKLRNKLTHLIKIVKVFFIRVFPRSIFHLKIEVRYTLVKITYFYAKNIDPFVDALLKEPRKVQLRKQSLAFFSDGNAFSICQRKSVIKIVVKSLFNGINPLGMDILYLRY
jgi:hypothetical protein